MNTDFITAIDIGTTKIVALVGKKNNNEKLKILGIGKSPSKGIKRGTVINIKETVDAIKFAVLKAENSAGVRISDVFASISGHHIKSVKNRVYINKGFYNQEITQEDIHKLINEGKKIPAQSGEEIIHLFPHSYIVDNEAQIKTPPLGMFGKKLGANFHTIIAQVASANNIKKCINTAGLQLSNLIFEPLASSFAVLTNDEKEAGVALVDIGGGTTDIAVYYDGIIQHTTVIPFGGNSVTNDIKIGCSILLRQAEALKLQYGHALNEENLENNVIRITGINDRQDKKISFKNLTYIIEARMEEIISAVLFKIETSGYIDKLGAGIVLTGGGALLKNLKQLVSNKTAMEVRIGIPNQSLIENTNEEVNQAIYSTSVGLILKAYEQIENVGQDLIQNKTQKARKKIYRNILKKEKNSANKIPIDKWFQNQFDKFGNLFEENDSQM